MTEQEFRNRYKFDIHKEEDYLGHGAYGKVYRAYDAVESRYVALKVSPVIKGEEKNSLLNEVERAKNFTHPNIANYIACYRFDSLHGTFDWGVLQYYKDGNLSDFMKKNQLTTEQKKGIVNEMVAGLTYLDQHQVVHRDLKSSNILIAQNEYTKAIVPKIADFGLSKSYYLNADANMSQSFKGGTLSYAAPEQLRGDKSIKKNVDLWSFGVIVYELFIGQRPFYPKSAAANTEAGRMEVVQQINKAQYDKADLTKIPEPYRTVVSSCLVAEPEERAKDIDSIRMILGLNETMTDETDIEGNDEPVVITDEPKPKFPKGLLIGCLVGLLVGFAWWFWPTGSTSTIPTDDTSQVIEQPSTDEVPDVNEPEEESTQPEKPNPIPTSEKKFNIETAISALNGLSDKNGRYQYTKENRQKLENLFSTDAYFIVNGERNKLSSFWTFISNKPDKKIMIENTIMENGKIKTLKIKTN